MKKTKTIVFYVFLAYNLVLFLATLYVESNQNDLGFLLEMKSYISFFKYFTFSGLILYLLSYFLIQRDSTKLSKDIKKEQEEKTLLKAKLFDLQEETRKDISDHTQIPESTPTPEKNDDKAES